jgi:Protein of unknown function with PCYCGC motif
MTHETTAATPLSWKEHLWMALLVGLLFFIVWTRLPANAAAPQGNSSDASGYIRREKKPVLSPALFVGQTARAYRIAQEIPDVLDQLYCYCECDRHLGHKSLLSCFTDDHGAG